MLTNKSNVLFCSAVKRAGLLVLPCLVACSGAASPAGDGSGGQGGDGGGDSTTTPEPSLGTFKPGPGGLRRLTVEQYKNALNDLLGVDPTSPIEADEVINGFASIAATRLTLSAPSVEAFETAALGTASKALGDSTKRSRFITCTPKGSTDDACALAAVKAFGRRAWRRPLTDDEAERYADVARTASSMLGDFYKGLSYAVAGLLQSPYFLYRNELGNIDLGASDGRKRLDGYELATRLSFFFWNTTPDDELLDEAEAGGLDDAAGVKRQIGRLLASDRATRAPRAFFNELLGLNGLDKLPHVKALYPKVTDTLGASMREETLRTLEDAFVSGQSWNDTFTRHDTFLNEELANLYGIKGVSGSAFKAAKLPSDGPRMGLLGQGSFLASHAHPTSTSPTLRGKAIRQTFLCNDIPAPPANVKAEIPENDPNADQKTLRERLSAHRENDACRSCHAIMDPIGLALENFDALGEYRTMDSGKPIDATGDLDDTKFNGASELSKVLAAREDVNQCLVNNLFRYALGHVETDDEAAALAHLAQLWNDKQHDVKALFSLLAAHDSFTFVTSPEQGSN